MSKFNDLLNLRFKTKETQQPKMAALVERSSKGDLSSFAGIFRVTALNEEEKGAIASILNAFRRDENHPLEPDLEALIALTSEVKAIANQAVILHGERIKKAQDILKAYQDGAFTAWLYATYGNRQTPYNFLQYYEFYCLMPSLLHPKIDQMPRQAIYTLASRIGPFEKKEEIVKNYTGQPKQELLKQIRENFPLAEGDKRNQQFGIQGLCFLRKARDLFKNPRCRLSKIEMDKAKQLLETIQQCIQGFDVPQPGSPSA